MRSLDTPLTRAAGIEVPVICGAMYPCSNPELIAAVSDAGGIGIVQPLSMIYVYGLDFRQGLRKIKQITSKPFGMNVILEQSSKIYERRMRGWIDIALEEGCRFFVTALGNPVWVVRQVHAAKGVVYHDATERKWAQKGLDAGVDGIICVNNRAGGHAGSRSPEQLYEEFAPLGAPLVCAGGIGDEHAFCRALDLGYAGVQMGTRFIATDECASHRDYKNAVVNASSDQIVLTERVTGIPLSVIRTPYVDAVGTRIGPIARFLFRFRRTRNWMRTWYNLYSLWAVRRSSLKGLSTRDYYQAGKSVDGVEKIEPAGEIVRRFADTWRSYPEKV